jgi:hypothetical protein
VIVVGGANDDGDSGKGTGDGSSPPTPPSMPPPQAPPQATMSIRFTLRASGAVEDYTETVIGDIAQAIAARAGVDASQVSVGVSQGSVLLTISIVTYAADDDAEVASAMESGVADPSAATALLASCCSVDITVDSVIVAPQAALLAPASPPSPPPQEMSTNSPAELVPLRVGGVGGAVGTIGTILALAAWRRRRGSKPTSAPVHGAATV